MHSSPIVAILDSLTGGEVMLILFFGLIILGPERLPEVARSIGNWLAQAKRYAARMQDDVRDVLDDPTMQGIKEVGEFVARPRQKLTEYMTAAERETSQGSTDAPSAVGENSAAQSDGALKEPSPGATGGFVRPDFQSPLQGQEASADEAP